MKKIIRISLFCMLFFLFPLCINAAELETSGSEAEKSEVEGLGAETEKSETEVKMITGFEYQEPILETLHIAYEQKPTKAELIQVLPQQMNVYLDDSSEVTTIDVTWFDITEDYDTSSAYYYQFSPSWDAEQYVLADSINLYTEVPYVAVFFYSADSGLSTMAATSYSNETIVYEFLRDNFNLNTAAICGILANLQKESSFDPSTFNGNDTGGTVSYGLCQWNSGGGRYYTLMEWCEANGYDYTTLEGQLNFMKHELMTKSYYRLSELENNIENSADGAYNASMLFSKYYEGCSKRYYEERANLAKNTYWPAYCHLAGMHPAFNDVFTSDWYYDPVDYVYNRGLMTGMNATTFGPTENLSRAQFVVILHRMVGAPEAVYEDKFLDVEDGTWYTDAVMWSSNGYVVTGYDNGCFGPADYITREQVATMLHRFATGLTFNVAASTDLSGYVDHAAVSPFAQTAMEWAVGTGIISGTEGGTCLSPQSYASRAECATMIMRFCNVYGF